MPQAWFYTKPSLGLLSSRSLETRSFRIAHARGASLGSEFLNIELIMTVDYTKEFNHIQVTGQSNIACSQMQVIIGGGVDALSTKTPHT